MGGCMADTRLLTLDDIARALDYINFDDRETWVNMAFAVKSEFGEAGFDTWDSWSQRSDSYKRDSARAVWKSAKAGGKIGIGTLIKLAQDRGFKFSVKDISQEERARRKAEAEQRRAENKRRREAEKQAEKERKETAAARAANIWPGLPREGYSEYLARKKIFGFEARYARDGKIALPVHKNGVLVGLQWISGDGTKKFLTGTDKSGSSLVIGKADGSPHILCEGYATGCSIAMAMPGAVVEVCFDDGNLKKVALKRAADGLKNLVIAADNDATTPGNPGLKAAQAVNQLYPVVRCVWPVGETGEKIDFNDLHVARGLKAVAAVFESTEKQVFPPGVGEKSREKSGTDGQTDNDQGEKSRAKPPSLAGPGGFSFTLDFMLANYAHVYGKTPQIFDKRARKLISPATLNEIAKKSYEKWKGEDDRHIVDESCVVFDPSESVDPLTHVNLFGGFPMSPKAGQCDKIIALLYYLVGENDQAFDWVLRWIALPLQKPGAKMRTAIVMHGTEGAGKNLFWNVIEQIYGEYSTIITQNEIESQFNGWASKKLFVIGNEVVSRQEMYHKKGIIKNMITEPEWLINDKNMPLRKEANHANFVFFSNVMQPVTPDTGDRRFMVIWTPKKEQPDYYRAVVEQIRNGGVQAFYDYLLKLDLGEFSEWSEPVMTQAKTDLIDLSMRSDERFVNRWKASDLPVPFQPCRTVDLYAAYQHWARVEGEKFTVSKTEFLMRLARDDDTEKTQENYLDGTTLKKTSFIGPVGGMAKRPADISKQKHAGMMYESFLAELRDWKGGPAYVD